MHSVSCRRPSYLGLPSPLDLVSLPRILLSQYHQPNRTHTSSGRRRGRGTRRKHCPKKRRAILVGISYAHSQSDTWWPLDGPHGDVDGFRDLLVRKQSSSPRRVWLDVLSNFIFKGSMGILRTKSPCSMIVPTSQTTCSQLMPIS